MIRRCTAADFDTMHEIINDAAEAYRGVIPADRWHEPYMSRKQLAADIAAGVEFWGTDVDGVLAGVMGIQRVRDVTLIRHAYVRTSLRGRGLGGELLDALCAQANGRLLVGTWADAAWAVAFYQHHGFQLLPTIEKNELLDAYWTIPDRQRDTSVVLERAQH